MMRADSLDQMVREQIAARGVRNERVLDAMRKIDRRLFVPKTFAHQAYDDTALPVLAKSTISQPYIVGLMTELLDPQPEDKVLEIGCGTGYQTAILAFLGREVWSLEIIPELAGTACSRIHEMGIRNARVLNRSGWDGLPEEAPFAKIIVTAAPSVLPEALKQQLSHDGRMVVPIGVGEQDLLVVSKNSAGQFTETNVAPVRFVPMVKDLQQQDQS